jgi:DNA gyrase subunit B
MSYNANDIQTLSFLDAIRTRVAMYMGSADNQGVLQCVREIITNSIDEASMGYGKKIEVELLSDKEIRISDEGRGCPFGKRADGVESLEAIYTMPHSGGKFNSKTYQNVAGMNGIGAKGVALSSDIFKVTSYRDGKAATLELEKGVKTKFEVKDTKHKNGTVVYFTPSQEVYHLEPVKINFEDIKKMCKDWSFLNKNVKFVLKNKQTGEKVVYHSKNGLVDLLQESGKKALNKSPLKFELEEDGIKVEVVAEWTDSRYEEWHVFTNGLENVEGGTSLTGVKTALTNFFKKHVGKDVSPELFRRGLYYAVSCVVPNPSFANQTKTKVNNPELRKLCRKATAKMLEEFEKRKRDEFNKVVELLTRESKAERAAERARKQVLEATKAIEKNQRRKVFASDKLKDAEFLGQDSTLLLVEGLSAGSSMATARDEKKYGILALRGKTVNAFSNNDEDFYNNEEVKLLLSALNIVPNKYDPKKLRYGRVAITVDSDSDGYSIGLLIMCALYKVAPQFIEEGRLCWLRSPLYIVKKGKEEKYYFTDEEFNKATKGGIVQRNKGLGSLSPSQARNSMFSKEYQRMDVLKPDEQSLPLLLELMGKDSAPKKKFIFENVDFSEIRE